MRDVLSELREKAPDLPALRARYEGTDRGTCLRSPALEPPGASGSSPSSPPSTPPPLTRAFEAARRLANGPRERLEPPAVERLPERGGDAWPGIEARARGEALLAEGAVAVARRRGRPGHPARLPGPEGRLPARARHGPDPLRAAGAEDPRGAARRFGRPDPVARDDEPRDRRRDARTLRAERTPSASPPADVRFFAQGCFPSVDFDGRLILEAPDRIAVSPDGHGGVLTALAAVRRASPARGPRRDAPSLLLPGRQPARPARRPALPRPPRLARRRDVGEGARQARARGARGHVRRVEAAASASSSTPRSTPWHRDQRDAGGELALLGGQHRDARPRPSLSRGASPRRPTPPPLPRVAEEDPDASTPTGRPLVPDAPNGYKLERFVFDALPEARRVALLEVRRAEEYSPIKNRTAADPRARRASDLVACYRRWLDAAGVTGVPGDAWIELDESRIDGPDDFRAAGVRAVGPGDRLDPLREVEEPHEPCEESRSKKPAKKPAPKPPAGSRSRASPPRRRRPPAKPAPKKKAAVDATAPQQAAPAPARCPEEGARSARRPDAAMRRQPRRPRPQAPGATAARPPQGAEEAARPSSGPGAPIVPDIVKPGLGGRWECYSCGSKFYDLGKPEPLCPKCGADQREKPREKPTPPTPQPEKPRRAAVPMGSLLDDETRSRSRSTRRRKATSPASTPRPSSPSPPTEEEEEVDVTTIEED